MKNPNGYGSVIKLSGKRRKPFAARITKGFTEEGKQIFKYIGYYGTRKEAMQQLAQYNNSSYDVDLANITLQEIYDRYVDSQKNKVGKGRKATYKTMHSYLKPLLGFKMIEIKTVQLQRLVDNLTGAISTGTLKGVKSFLNSLFQYAMKIEAIEKNYVPFITLPRHKKVINRKIFTEKEIEALWENCEKIDYIDVLLILIYTGMRINELLNLEKASVDLKNNTITGGSKTEAGTDRIIPIHPKILPLIIRRMGNKTKYLIPNKTGKNKLIYTSFKKTSFAEIMERLGMKHTIHDTRHTFVTMITDVSSNDVAITKIIGHTDISMTKHYTHTNVEKLRKEIEKIN